MARRDKPLETRAAMRRTPDHSSRQGSGQPAADSHQPGRPDDKPATLSSLRAAIDSGRTGDKVDAADPAAAPLGSDDEAADTPPTTEQVRQAVLSETTRPQHQKRMEGLGFAWILIVLVVVLILGLVAWAVVER